MKKRVLAAALLLCMLSGCGDGKRPESEDAAEPVASETQAESSESQAGGVSSGAESEDENEPEFFYSKYKPEPSDYETSVITAKIHEELPEFTFEILSYLDGDYGFHPVESIKISDGEKELQTIPIPELAMFRHTTYRPAYNHEDEGRMGFELEDLNFDGYLDIRLFDTTNGNYKSEWIYLVWQPDKAVFENDKRLNKISLASFDQEKQLIYGMTRGSAVDHDYYTYKYIGGEPTLIEQFSQYALRDDEELILFLDSFGDTELPEGEHIRGYHELVTELNEGSGEMETARDEYVFYVVGNDSMLYHEKIIGRYASDSEMGRIYGAAEK